MLFLFLLVILCFYVLSMWFLSIKCVLGLFICFDIFLGLMIIGKALELVKTSWKEKRLIFGRFETVTSHATKDESLQRASVKSRHIWDDSAQGLKDLEDSRLSSFCISSITSSTNIQMKWFKLHWKDDSKI